MTPDEKAVAYRDKGFLISNLVVDANQAAARGLYITANRLRLKAVKLQTIDLQQRIDAIAAGSNES